MILSDHYSILRQRSESVTLALLCLLFAPAATAQVFSLEEPAFEVLAKSADYELRSYRPMVVAEVVVQGDIAVAGKEGARLVKDYIFRQGANESMDAGQRAEEKISMTVPVTMEKTPEKISMTVPVTMEGNAGSGYRLHFVMPSKYTKFSTEANIAEQTALLRNWMAQQGIKAAGEPQFARYDPPFVPPMLRRSEILIAVE